MQIGQHSVGTLGMGTWNLGEGSPAQTQNEIASLRAGLDNGLTVIDTAEMYGDGRAERLVGDALHGYERSRVYLISKFYPWHATATKMRAALTASLARLQTDYLDLYLLHWPGETPIGETLTALAAAKKEGLIRDYGVSNFAASELQQALAAPGGEGLVAKGSWRTKCCTI